MAQNLINALDELREANIIDAGTAERIQQYFHNKENSAGNRQTLVFGILGALLVGLGIILLIAHNWDSLAKPIRVAIAFAPLLLGQVLAALTFTRSFQKSAWREGAGIFLFLAIGSCISLVSQIYQIEGDLGSFLLTWMLLALPVVYALSSSFTSLLYIVGITLYAAQTGYWQYPGGSALWYWPLLLAILPYYFHLLKQRHSTNFVAFHSVGIPLSICTALGTLAGTQEELMVSAYLSLFTLFILVGLLLNDKTTHSGKQWIAVGWLGIVVVLMALSFKWYWHELRYHQLQMFSADVFISILLAVVVILIILYMARQRSQLLSNVILYGFVLFMVSLVVGHQLPWLSAVLINVYVLVLGISIIVQGSRSNSLWQLNAGMGIIAILTTCRFFDSNLSFVVRGLLFIIVGAGFFLGNYRMVMKKNREKILNP
jgi:uncharacterized membrane protein